MWDILLYGAAVGALAWGVINSSENRALKEKLARFERVHGAKGRFVSMRKKSPIEKFMDKEGRDARAGTNLLH